MRAVRLLVRFVAVVCALCAAAYAIARTKDPEKNTITDAVRDSVRKATGSAFVHLRDGVTHYEVAGADSAPLVVLAAGASVPGYIWQPTFDSLRANGYHVMRYDYYGRGWSDRPDIPLAQEVYVHQLDELLDSLHVTKPITLAGLSYGGTVITSYAVAHADRVGALVYVDPAIHQPRVIPWYLKVPVLSEMVFEWNLRNAAEGQLTDFLHPEKMPDWPDRYRPQMTYKGFRHGRLSDALANASFDQRPQLAEVGKNPRPVLVMWGKQDNTVPIAASKAVLEGLPRAKFVAVDSAGHLPIWEQPGVTHAALFDFLRSNAGPPAPSLEKTSKR